MALELPPELGAVLNLLGLEWPQVNEDEVVRLADELSKLASTLDSVQMAADKGLATLKEVYHGASADRLAEVWEGISKYSGLVVEACGVTANALHAAALVIEGCKAGALTQLVATQGELAAASVTGPWSSAAIIAAGKQIISTILEQAVSALGQALAQPIGDLVDTVVKDVMGSGSGSSNGAGFGVDLAKLASSALELRRHGDDIDSRGSSFKKILDGLDLGNPGDMFGKLVIEAAEQIATAVGEEVLKRLLGAFRGTADRMDQVGRNLTENEDSHVQQINGILAGMNSPSAKGPLKLAGGVSSLTSGLTHHAGPASDDAPHLDQAGGGSVGPFGLPVGHSAKSIGSSGLRVPEQAGAVPERAAATSQQPRPGSAGPRAVAPHHTGDPVSADGHRATQPGGLGRPSAAQPSGVSGVSGSAPYGQAGGATGQGAPGQVRDAASAQQRNTLRPREEERAMDPVELLADRPYEDAASEG